MTSTVRRRLRFRTRLLTEQAGVSLVELLATMAILSVVIAGLTGVFVSGSNAEIDLRKRFEAQNEARLGLQQFRRDVHRSCSAVVAPGGASVVLITMPYDTSTSACTLALATWCTTGSASTFTLRRAAGSAACTSSSTRHAGNLTSGGVFTAVPGTAGLGLLPRVAVDLPVDVDLKDARQSYRLVDSIALRNAPRS